MITLHLNCQAEKVDGVWQFDPASCVSPYSKTVQPQHEICRTSEACAQMGATMSLADLMPIMLALLGVIALAWSIKTVVAFLKHG